MLQFMLVGCMKSGILNYGKVAGYPYCPKTVDFKSSGTIGLVSNFNMEVMTLVLKMKNSNMQLPRAQACKFEHCNA
jgi:hypothetical protein